MTENRVWRWFDDTFLDLGRQFRWSYLPPLMIYLAAGVQGLTAIVGTFFIKEYLDLSAAFLAGLGFWVGIPWTLKMPLGHLVDLIWRRKALLVYIGAGLITLSILIMYGIIAHTQAMAAIMGVEIWFVIATLLAPTGYVVQDVVADAMTVEAVPTINEHGDPYPDEEIKVMHTTMQTLGRFAIIGGLAAVAALNITMFSGVENMSEEMKVEIYADIYLMALAIPLLSISGVILGGVMLRRRAQRMREQGNFDFPHPVPAYSLEVIDGGSEPDGSADVRRAGFEPFRAVAEGGALDRDPLDHVATAEERGHGLEEREPPPERPDPARAEELVTVWDVAFGRIKDMAAQASITVAGSIGAMFNASDAASAGKALLKTVGNVEIPQRAFLAVLKSDQ